MISVRLNANTEPLDNLDKYLSRFPQEAARVGQDVYESIKPQLLEALRFYPPVPAGSTYKRTYKLRNNWDVTFESSSDGFRLTILNDTNYAIWVVGSLAQNPSNAKRYQQAFHARNGWPLATKTAAFWFDVFTEAFTEAFIADIRSFGLITFNRRAVTRIE